MLLERGRGREADRIEPGAGRETHCARPEVLTDSSTRETRAALVEQCITCGMPSMRIKWFALAYIAFGPVYGWTQVSGCATSVDHPARSPSPR